MTWCFMRAQGPSQGMKETASFLCLQARTVLKIVSLTPWRHADRLRPAGMVEAKDNTLLTSTKVFDLPSSSKSCVLGPTQSKNIVARRSPLL